MIMLELLSLTQSFVAKEYVIKRSREKEEEFKRNQRVALNTWTGVQTCGGYLLEGN